jgi:PAS domain S-box-containing protein
MKFILGNKRHPVRWFTNAVFLLIGLVWVHLLVGKTADVFQWQSHALWQLIGDIFFAGVVTAALLFLHNKFNEQIADHVRGHIKLFKKNPYPMWMYDLNTLQFLTVNDAALALYGYSEAEFLALRITDIRPLEDAPAIISSTDQIKLNFNHQYHWSGTWRHKKKNGELIYVEISSHEVLFEGKKAELVLAYDITDQVLQDQKLQALNQDLERKVMLRTNDLLNLNRRLVDQNKVIKSANLELFTISNELQEANLKIQEHADLKNRFVSMASHEFRTPLANIAFSAGFIRHHFHKLEPQNIMAKLQGIESHVAHMAALLDDVLTIGKEDAEKLEVKKNCLDVSEFIAKIGQEVQTANNNSHLLHISKSDNAAQHLYTDEKFLRNIFINLLNNAIKYSAGHQHVYVNIYSLENETYFEITDKGMGIGKQDLDKIFEPFYRTDSTRNIKGTGLGLSIVKRAVNLLGARIQVQSELGKGSTFTVILPVQHAA